MEDDSFTRRNLLKTGVTAATGGLVATTAGCLGGAPGVSLLGGDGRYTDWLVAPDKLGDSDHYSFYHLRPAAFADHEDQLGSDNYDQLEMLFSGPAERWTGVDFDEVTDLVSFGPASVYTTEVPEADVVEDLEDEDFDDESDLEGYTVYVSSDESVAVGVNGETLVWGRESYQGSDAVDVVERVIEAKAGEEDRYADENEHFTALVDRLGDGDLVYGRTREESDADDPANGEFRDLVARGTTVSLDGETADMRWALVFEDENDIDVDDVKEYVDENDGSDGTFDDLDDVSVSSSGRSAIVTGSKDADDLLS
ncbi:hypothetical protein [Halomarina litorea]|uniref:hypothetical protein n=1 Tax=Halomarina litorea TaxID=2961595 RepID=UPI0020C3C005|nr:hypothetical protein [Halomarina sp. BCD28]